MPKVTNIQNQSLLDLAMVTQGSIEAVFELALLNDLAIAASLPVGTKVNYTAVKHPVVTYFTEKGQSIATLQDYESSNLTGVLPVINTTLNERDSNVFITEDYQCILDVALSEFGTVEAIFDLALQNNTKINALPVPGTLLTLPRHDKVSNITNYTYKNNLRFATTTPEVAQHLFENGLFEIGLFT